MKNKLVDIIKTHYSPLGRGGAMAYNGYENVVFFKDYLISKQAVGRLPSLSGQIINFMFLSRVNVYLTFRMLLYFLSSVGSIF